MDKEHESPKMGGAAFFDETAFQEKEIAVASLFRPPISELSDKIARRVLEDSGIDPDKHKEELKAARHAAATHRAISLAWEAVGDDGANPVEELDFNKEVERVIPSATFQQRADLDREFTRCCMESFVFGFLYGMHDGANV